MAVINWPRDCRRGPDDHRGLSTSTELTSPSRRVLSRFLSGQWRIACWRVSGDEPHRGQVVSGRSLHHERWAAR